jgi:hypothetical protein
LRSRRATSLARTAAGLGALATLFACIYRPWHLRWGASDEEVHGAMPGDELVPDAHFSATRGITVRAQPEQIWPWLAQIGYGRAGFYAYDFLDLVLPCLVSPSAGEPRRACVGKRSAEVIIDDLQDVQVGTWIPMAPGQPSRETAFRVRASERNH